MGFNPLGRIKKALGRRRGAGKGLSAETTGKQRAADFSASRSQLAGPVDIAIAKANVPSGKHAAVKALIEQWGQGNVADIRGQLGKVIGPDLVETFMHEFGVARHGGRVEKQE